MNTYFHRRLAWRMVGLLSGVTLSLHALAECNVEHGATFNGTDVFITKPKPNARMAYFFRTSNVVIDANGAPNAYNPDNTGLALLADAGYPDTLLWPSILVQDPANPKQALVRKDGPHKGYFISKTALSAPNLDNADPLKFVDAANFPYIAVPPLWAGYKVTGAIGDLAYARSLDGKLSSPAVLGDTQGSCNAKLGGVSVKLAQVLGSVSASPRTPPQNIGELIYVVFPGTAFSPVWPISEVAMKKRAADLLAEIGGWPDVACLAKPKTAATSPKNQPPWLPDRGLQRVATTGSTHAKSAYGSNACR